MEKINMDEYKEIESKIDSMTSEEELIENHKKLIGKTCKSDYWEVKDCGIEFINKFLSRDSGRTIVYHYSKGAEQFMKSAYLSIYIKQRIKNMFVEMDDVAGDKYLCTPNIEKILDSSKTINEMTEDEIKNIYTKLAEYTASNNRYIETLGEKMDYKTANCFRTLLYKLDGDGVTACIKDDNYVSKRQLADELLYTSGLDNRASYYSGRGVNYGDLNDDNLVAIFNKLLKLDIDYATNFVDMVQKMETLGATEFVDTFINFANNHFKCDGLDIENSQISLNGCADNERYVIGFLSLVEKSHRGNDQDDQIRASKQMKDVFIAKISPVLQEIKPNGILSDDNLYAKRKVN